jgi:hypothetical protein
MAYCSNCGKLLEGAGRFCSSCGGPVPDSAAGWVVASPPPSPPPAPVYSQGGAYPPGGAYPQGDPAPQKAGHGLTWLLSGIGALVVIVAVVCILVFVVFNGEESEEARSALTTVPVVETTLTTALADSATAPTAAPTSSTEATSQDTSDPEQVVQQVFDAMETQDVDALIALMDPSLFAALPEGETLDVVKSAMAAELEAMGSMEFSGIEMSIEMTSEARATATLTAGVVTVTDAEGMTTSEDVKEADSPVTIDLVKVDGKWYMESAPFL